MIEIGTKEGDLVLDPFIGSGTTACACKKLNRNFIGFELNPDYCKIANERLANTFVTKKNYGGYFK
jgi:DNA modification methylase